jgi:hypothetical protein
MVERSLTGGEISARQRRPTGGEVRANPTESNPIRPLDGMGRLYCRCNVGGQAGSLYHLVASGPGESC